MGSLKRLVVNLPVELTFLTYDKEYLRYAIGGYALEHCDNYVGNYWELTLVRRYPNGPIARKYLYVRTEEHPEGWTIAEKSWED